MIRTIDQIVLLLAITLLLTGCETTGGTAKNVCDALIGPIKYNSTNPASPRHAGPALAPDLAVRNRVGVNLRCQSYR